ncbi:MAG: LysR family transcriptional regulator [Pseudomonadota bacterium]
MDMKQLRCIVAIAEEGNITHAAQKVFISQPALSQLLRKLENTLGTPLFVRDGRIVTPTTAGKIYLNGARAILNINEALAGKMQKAKTLPDRINVRISSALPRDIISGIVPMLRKANTSINISIEADLQGRYTRLLMDSECDIAVSEIPSSKDPDFLYFPIRRERLYFLCPRDYDSSSKNPAGLILSTRGTLLRNLEDVALEKLSIHSEIAYETDDRELALELAREKAGFVFVLSKAALPEERSHRIVDLPFCPEVEVALICGARSPFRAMLR